LEQAVKGLQHFIVVTLGLDDFFIKLGLDHLNSKVKVMNNCKQFIWFRYLGKSTNMSYAKITPICIALQN